MTPCRHGHAPPIRRLLRTRTDVAPALVEGLSTGWRPELSTADPRFPNPFGVGKNFSRSRQRGQLRRSAGRFADAGIWSRYGPLHDDSDWAASCARDVGSCGIRTPTDRGSDHRGSHSGIRRPGRVPILGEGTSQHREQRILGEDLQPVPRGQALIEVECA